MVEAKLVPSGAGGAMRRAINMSMKYCTHASATQSLQTADNVARGSFYASEHEDVVKRERSAVLCLIHEAMPHCTGAERSGDDH